MENLGKAGLQVNLKKGTRLNLSCGSYIYIFLYMCECLVSDLPQTTRVLVEEVNWECFSGEFFAVTCMKCAAGIKALRVCSRSCRSSDGTELTTAGH